MSRLKENISSLVSLQLPEHIRDDYPQFVAFVEAYYRYLEQDSYAQEVIQNATQYSDIDLTIDSFIQYFMNQYCRDIPVDIIGDKKLVVKYINDIYNSKGSEESYTALFRLLFNKLVDIFYPSTQILRASDGKWIQRMSLFVQPVYGNITSIINREVTIINASYQYPLKITNVRSAYDSDGIAEGIYEVFIKNNKNIPIVVGDFVEIEGFRGVVVSAPTRVSIIQGGTGFRVGDVLTLTSNNGSRLKVKVLGVTSTGAVRTIQIISFGVGYVSDFYNSFSSTTLEQSDTQFSLIGDQVGIGDSIAGFVDEGVIYSSNYSSGYFSDDYVGTVLSSFYTNSSTNEGATTGTSSDCVLYVTLGSIAKYPGFYENNDGFLSDTVYLQDADYYQPFSYVVKIDEQLQDYKQTLLELLHPAGTKLFGEYLLNNDIDISSEVTALFKYLNTRLLDIINISDIVGYDLDRTITDESELIDSSVLDIDKNISESLTIDDSFSTATTRTLEESSEAIDSIGLEIFLDPSGVGVFSDTYAPGSSIYATDYFAEDYTYVENAVFISDSIDIQFT